MSISSWPSLLLVPMKDYHGRFSGKLKSVAIQLWHLFAQELSWRKVSEWKVDYLASRGHGCNVRFLTNIPELVAQCSEH